LAVYASKRSKIPHGVCLPDTKTVTQNDYLVHPLCLFVELLDFDPDGYAGKLDQHTMKVWVYPRRILILFDGQGKCRFRPIDLLG
jgi:hypothetical protein